MKYRLRTPVGQLDPLVSHTAGQVLLNREQSISELNDLHTRILEAYGEYRI